MAADGIQTLLILLVQQECEVLENLSRQQQEPTSSNSSTLPTDFECPNTKWRGTDTFDICSESVIWPISWHAVLWAPGSPSAPPPSSPLNTSQSNRDTIREPSEGQNCSWPSNAVSSTRSRRDRKTKNIQKKRVEGRAKNRKKETKFLKPDTPTPRELNEDDWY